MLKRTTTLLAAAAFACLGTAGTATAQSDCHCDCYFSGDCESGNFCNWGNLGNEDTCWWRTPKPQGNPGQGCGGDYGNWGQCDGHCDSTTARTTVGGELQSNLIQGVELWAAAFNDASRNGGGLPSIDYIRQIDDIPFENPTMGYGLWRMSIEMLMLSRGGMDYLDFPETEVYELYEVGVGDLRDRPDLMRSGNLAMKAMVAEIREPGSGLAFVMRINPDLLDSEMFDRICDSGTSDIRMCLYDRIVDMSVVLSQGADDVENDRGNTDVCGGCYADCNPNDGVDVDDLLLVLEEWGSTSFPNADIDADGIVDVNDLLGVIGAWGPCAD